MFVRRLLMIAAAVGLCGGVLMAQAARLGVLKHEQALSDARDRLYRVTWSPSVRGRILDRKGRVLARDRASYSVGVEYRVLTGDWAKRQARTRARDKHRDAWGLLSPEDRATLIADEQPMFEAHVDHLWARLAVLTGTPEETIRERTGRTLDRVDRLRGSIQSRRRRHAMIDAVARGRQQTPEMLAEIEQRAEIELLEERQSHVLVEEVPDEVAFELIRLSARRTKLIAADGESVEVDLMPGLDIQRSADRMYPFDQLVIEVDRSAYPKPIRTDEPISISLQGVAAHTLGWVRSGAHKDDLERRANALEQNESLRTRSMTGVLGSRDGNGIDRGRYRPSDVIGRGGVEYARENTLRGLRGVAIERLDTGERTSEMPELGRDVTLSLDIMLQARVRALMEPEAGLAVVQPWHNNDDMELGTPLRGAAVVLDVDTGEVLAMVSTPSIDREALDEDPLAVLDDPDRPLFNRAIGAAYAPGSIAKALILCGAVTYGNYTLGETISCEGYLLPGRNDIYRCWIYRERFGYATHDAVLGHEPDDVDALCVSCNIFFYTMGRRMGVETIEKTYRAFGLGERFGFGIGFEHDGRIGAPGMQLGTSDAILMGIGQGPVDWTPMHAASAYGTLARLGVRVSPRLYLDDSPPAPTDSGINRRAIAHALAGLERVTNDPTYGTAYAIRFPTGRDPIFNTPGTKVLGKTGTATVEMRLPTGEQVTRDNAWMVALAGPEGRPAKYAVCVLLELGGSGGRASGALVNQIIRALRSEGYL